MKARRPSLIIPVEIQVREFDAKLLLACVAAERGFRVIIGSRTAVNMKINRLPRSIYLAKGVTKPSHKMFSILTRLGHRLVSWDEEALVYYNPDYYLRRRVFVPSLEKVSILFAWGEDNARIWQEYPGYHGAPIHVTGNPRVDLLRPELRGVFAEDAKALIARYGDFVLINSNFGSVNFFYPDATPLKLQEQIPSSAAVARDDFTSGLAVHRHALFQKFLEIVPLMAKAIPNMRLVIRPHPAENHEPWKRAAAGCPNVEIVHQGNIVPWLLAARAIVHNGCTTAVESFILDRPVFSYRPIASATFDTHLPNELSEQVFDADSLIAGLRRTIAGEQVRDAAAVADRRRLIERYVAALSGPLSSDRVMDVLEQAVGADDILPKTTIRTTIAARIEAKIRALKKRKNFWRPNHKGNIAFQSSNFPGLSEQEIGLRIARYQALLDRFRDVRARQITPGIFEVARSAAAVPTGQ